MRVLLLPFLAGLCTGLQYPLQYVYHYRAKVSSGIADVNTKHSAISELKANLGVFVTSPSTVVFKLEDVFFRDFNGIKRCGHCKNQSSSWDPQYSSQIGRYPFAVENGVFVFNAEEEQWTINFYKSIISLFSIAPLKEAFYSTSSNYTDSAAYATMEDTVMGMCTNTYTQHKLTGVAAAQREQFMGHHVTEDVQADSLGEYVAPGNSKTTKTTGGRKTSTSPRRRRRSTKRPPSKTSKTSKIPQYAQRAPAISNTLWEVVRSVNLDDCVDRVEHQHALGGLYCLLSEDQCENLFSRNSHGVYNLRGDENGMRLEKAKIKGAIVISPYGFETEHIETITQQMVGLVSVNHLDIDAPNLTGDTTVTTDELVYELTLPYEDAGQSNYRWAKMGTMKETLAALTAVYITEELQRENEERVINTLNIAAIAAASGNSETTQQAPALLNYAAILMYDFTKDEIARVSAGLQPASRELFYGVLAEVGTQPALDVMLGLIESGEVSAFRQVIYFGSLNVNIKSATPLRSILNFLKSENLDEAPFKTSQSLINFVSAVKRLCLGRRDGANSFQSIAAQRCVQDGIVAELQEYLVSELQGATQFWKQMVLVKALVNMETVEATNALLPYVLGARECDDMVRAVAMDSLAKWNAASPLYKSKIILILLDIFENPAESRLLRARALGYLGSWDLTSTEWTRLAFTTKRQGLKDLAALTYSLIKATAEYEHPEMIQQRQYAQHALHIAKPSAAADRYSSYKTWFSYNFANQVGTIDHFSEIKDPMSPLPAELAIYIQRNLAGTMFFRKADFMIANDNGNLEDIALELFLGITPSYGDGSGSGQRSSYFSMIESSLNIQGKVKAAIRGMASVVGTGQMQLFVPFERVMLVDAMKSISGDRAPYFHIEGPTSLYINPTDTTFTTINDLGLPVITNMARPTLVNYRGSADFSNSGPDRYTLESESFGVVMASFTRVNIETMIPWSRTKVAAGVANSISANMPFSPKFEVSVPSSTEPSSLILEVAPSIFAKTTVLKKMNMPYTFIRDTAPANLEVVAQALQIIYVNGEKGPKYQENLNVPFTPMLEASYASDYNVVLGYQTSRVDKLSWPDLRLENLVLFPNLKFFSASISLDLTGMETSSIRLNFTSTTAERLSNAGKFVSKYGQDSFEDYELCGKEGSADTYTQQTGQQSSDDYMFEQSSQSVQSLDQEFESFGAFGQQQAQAPAPLYDPTEAETVRPSQGIGDVSEPQLNSFLSYLQRQAGWKSWVSGISLRFEVFNAGSIVVASEAVYAETKCYALLDQVLTKRVFVIANKGDPCDTLCFETEVTSPKVNDLDTLPLLYAKNLNTTKKTQVYTGRKCSEGPFLSLLEKRELSEAGRQRLVEELDNSQKCGSPQDPVKEFVKTAQYDRSKFSSNATLVHTLGECKSPMASFLMIKALPLFREKVMNLKTNFHFCPSDFSSTEIQINGISNRSEDGSWRYEEHFGEKSLFQGTPALPSWFDDFNMIGFQSDYVGHDYCVIDQQKVTTFDGMRTNFNSSSCPVVVSTPCEEGQLDSFIVSVTTSRSGGLAVHVGGKIKQLIININDGDVEVRCPAGCNPNENFGSDEYVRTIHYDDERRVRKEAGRIYKRYGFFKIEIDDTVDVILKDDKIYISVADRYRGYMCGLCGNYDDEPSNDMKAPNGCLITDSEEFGKAWTPSTGFECFAEQQTDPDTCLKEEPLPHDYYEQYQLQHAAESNACARVACKG